MRIAIEKFKSQTLEDTCVDRNCTLGGFRFSGLLTILILMMETLEQITTTQPTHLLGIVPVKSIGIAIAEGNENIKTDTGYYCEAN